MLAFRISSVRSGIYFTGYTPKLGAYGYSRRDRKTIQYIADISVDGTEMHNVKISNRESLYAPKSVVKAW